MSIESTYCGSVSEAQAVAEINHEGFQAATKNYAAGKTEPHHHDYDICLHILLGEFRLGVVDEDVVHSFGPGHRVFVPAGTLHFEDHGPLRMVVGRRNSEEPGADGRENA
jgi:hypothetical protein